MSLGPITALVPVPRKVRLGDRDFRVGEFRLIDLAEMQASLDESVPDVLDEVLEKTEGADAETRRSVLADAYDRLASGLPTIWDDRGSEWFGTVEGLATFVFVALRRYHPEIQAAEVVDLCLQADPRQIDRMRRICFGVRPLKALERMLGLVPIERPGPGPRTPWTQLVAEVADQYKCADLSVIYQRTLTEFAALRTGGRLADDEEGVEIPDDADMARLAREQFERFHGRPPEPEDEV